MSVDTKAIRQLIDDAHGMGIDGIVEVDRLKELEPRDRFNTRRFVFHGRKLLGDACDALDAARALNAEALKLVRAVEWSGRSVDGDAACPSCDELAAGGNHHDGCDLDILLDKLEAAR